MKNKVKKIPKKTMLAFIICAITFSMIGATASTLLYSKDVTYDNSSSGLSSTNLQDALDELYEQAKTGGASVSCDSEGNCTVTCKQGNPTITDSGYSCTTSTSVECPSGLNYVATSTGYKCIKTAGAQLLAKVDVVTSGSGLYEDSAESGRYIYRGASPSNYITFNGESAGWRIISVESDGTIKIIKNEQLSSTYAWDAAGNRSTANYCSYSSTYGCSVWGSSSTMTPTTMAREIGGTAYALPSNEASLNTYLNTTYYNNLSSTAQSQIVSHTFNVGVVGTNSDTCAISTSVTREQANKWTGKIALITITEYMRATTSTSCTSLSAGWNSKSACSSNNWMFKSIAEWFLSPYSSNDSYVVWIVLGGGNFYYGSCGWTTSSYGVRPVLHLSSDITLSGSGTESDPYVIS